MKKKSHAALRKASLLASLLFTAASLQAASIVWTFDTGATTCPNPSSGTCKGEAVFNYTPGASSFTITLNNLLPDIKDAGELLTDVQFTTTLAGLALTSSSGIPVNIDGSGNATVGSAITTGWAFGSIGPNPNTWLLCVICRGNTGDPSTSTAPAHGIVPNEASYPNANNSIAGNGPHNPVLESGATFNFSTTSVLPINPSIDPFSNVFISFGTTFGEVGTTASAPEPLTPLLAGAGLIALGLIGRRRRTIKA